MGPRAGVIQVKLENGNKVGEVRLRSQWLYVPQVGEVVEAEHEHTGESLSGVVTRIQSKTAIQKPAPAADPSVVQNFFVYVE